MVFLDFVILWVFLLEVTTFGDLRFLHFCGINPFFLYIIITLLRGSEFGNLGEKVQRLQRGKADAGIRTLTTKRA